MKGGDGKYHIRGRTYAKLIGSRAEVMHRTAYKTAGGLTREQLKYNRYGKIVSRVKSAKGAQMLKRLTRKGYLTRKGQFGWVRPGAKGAPSKSRRGDKDYTTKRGDLVFHRRKRYVRKGRRPFTRSRKKGTPSKTRPGRLNFTTKKGSRVFHRQGRYVRKNRRPYTKRQRRRRTIRGVKWEDRVRASGRFTSKPSYRR